MPGDIQTNAFLNTKQSAGEVNYISFTKAEYLPFGLALFIADTVADYYSPFYFVPVQAKVHAAIAPHAICTMRFTTSYVMQKTPALRHSFANILFLNHGHIYVYAHF